MMIENERSRILVRVRSRAAEQWRAAETTKQRPRYVFTAAEREKPFPGLSRAESTELLCRLERVGPVGFWSAYLEVIEEHGRIPTPVDDGLSGWIGSVLWDDDELMNTRVMSGPPWPMVLANLRSKDGRP